MKKDTTERMTYRNLTYIVRETDEENLESMEYEETNNTTDNNRRKTPRIREEILDTTE